LNSKVDDRPEPLELFSILLAEYLLFLERDAGFFLLKVEVADDRMKSTTRCGILSTLAFPANFVAGNDN